MLRRYVLFASLICSLLLVTAMTLPQRLMASSGSTWTQPDNWQQKEMVLAVLAPDKSYPGPLTDRIPKEDTSQSNLPETAKGEYSAKNCGSKALLLTTSRRLMIQKNLFLVQCLQQKKRLNPNLSQCPSPPWNRFQS